MAKNTQWCWLAREVKDGWKVTLEIGKYTFIPNPKEVYKTVKAVEKFANSFLPSDGKIVYMHLKNTKFPIK